MRSALFALAALLACAACLASAVPDAYLTATIDINATRVVFVVEPQFLSVTFDANSLPLDFDHVDFANPGLVNLCRALNPVWLRWGGTEGDWLHYAVDQESDPTPEQIEEWNKEILARVPEATPRPPEILSFNSFNNFTAFLNNVGWKLVFGLNALDRNPDGSWNSENDLRMINLVKSNPGRYPVVGFEFGNEPDLYSRSEVVVPAATLVKDSIALKSMIPEGSFLVGWDNATPYWEDLWNEILHEYREQEAGETLHFYYRHNATTMEASVDPLVLDQMIGFMQNASAIAAVNNFTRPLWLDKLGLAPLLGVGMVFRQTLRSNPDSIPPMHYGLIGPDLSPNCDFFSSILHKRLMGQAALDVSLTHDGGPVDTLRSYAHCTSLVASDSLPAGTVSPGAVTVMMLNVNKEYPFTVSFTTALTQLLGPTRLEFALSGSVVSSNWTEVLASPEMNLNGRLLRLGADGSLPPLVGVEVSNASPLAVHHLSYVFMVFPHAQLPACGYTGKDVKDVEASIALE